ncbi:hypothetical protein DH86_00001635 [Scytalidium sp. 3C]|nr:hypothetical protein DH86_00001635 [Scytalidium sp. 3C]
MENYTCASVGATPVAVGAVATLYDGTFLAETVEAELLAIPPLAVFLPLQESREFHFPGGESLDILGHHFFDAKGTPTFDLTSVNKVLAGKKTGDIKAPSDANKGPAGTGAVDWLQLDDNGSSTGGLSQVYRVTTAGGNPPATCPSTALIEVQYSALYFFYAN